MVAPLNSVLAGSLAGDISVLLDVGQAAALVIGAAVSIASAILHLLYAARFRERHEPLESNQPGLRD